MVKKKVGKIEIKTTKDKIKNNEKKVSPVIWNPFNYIEDIERPLWDDPWMPMWQRHRGPVIPRRFLGESWLDLGIKHTTIDIINTGKEFKIIAEMPGIKKEDIQVSINPNNISICGETKIEIKKDKEDFIRRERGYSALCRSMAFPEEVDPNKAEASLRDGILEIIVSKKKQARGRNIPVK